MQVSHTSICRCDACTGARPDNNNELIADRFTTPTDTFVAVGQHYDGVLWWVHYRRVPRDPLTREAVVEDWTPLTIWNKQVRHYQG